MFPFIPPSLPTMFKVPQKKAPRMALSKKKDFLGSLLIFSIKRLIVSNEF